MKADLDMSTSNVLLLFAQAAVYFTVMMSLLRGRKVMGIGVFMCALGVMHFLETYLASVFYIQLPFGIVSPGSTVLFSGKLLMILLLYIREDALIVRQAIYGLLIGNFLIVALVMILRNHDTVIVTGGRSPDLAFIDEIGLLMIWGSILLFIDSILIIVLYERIGDWLGRHLAWRFLICGGVVLTFDQAGFFLALHYVSGAPGHVFFGGWAAKMVAAAVYTVLFVAYLKYFDNEKSWLSNRPFRDVFQVLTYRERYNQLLEASIRDHLTGALDRGQYDAHAPAILARCLEENRDLSLLVVDIDHFKQVNDRHGHQMGDEVLKIVARLLSENLRSDDHFYRVGGEEFVLLSERLPTEAAMSMADRLRKTVARFSKVYLPEKVTVSIGVATAPVDGSSVDDLFKSADERMYRAKKNGRNQVVGRAGSTRDAVT